MIHCPALCLSFPLCADVPTPCQGMEPFPRSPASISEDAQSPGSATGPCPAAASSWQRPPPHPGLGLVVCLLLIRPQGGCTEQQPQTPGPLGPITVASPHPQPGGPISQLPPPHGATAEARGGGGHCLLSPPTDPCLGPAAPHCLLQAMPQRSTQFQPCPTGSVPAGGQGTAGQEEHSSGGT